MQHVYRLLFLFIGLPGIQYASAQHTVPVKLLSGADSLNFLGLEFSGARIYVLSDLAGSYRKNYLQVLDPNGVVQAQTTLPGHYTEILSTWNHTVFVGTADSVWQVVMQKDSIYLAYPMLTAKLKLLMHQVLLNADGIVFRRTEEFLGTRSRLHACYKDQNGKPIDLVVHTVVDTVTVDILKNTVRYKKKKKDRTSYLASASGQTSPEFEEYVTRYRAGSARSANGRMVPPGIVMCYLDENFYLYDYTNGNIVRFDRSLSHKSITDLQGVNQMTDAKQLLVDQATGHFFIIEKQGFKQVLKKYDRETGRMVCAKDISDLRHARHFRVHANRLYYIINPQPGTPSNQVLALQVD